MKKILPELSKPVDGDDLVDSLQAIHLAGEQTPINNKANKRKRGFSELTDDEISEINQKELYILEPIRDNPTTSTEQFPKKIKRSFSEEVLSKKEESKSNGRNSR